MKNPIVFMFSGQGTHYYHMGEELYYQNSIFKQWMDRLDRIIYQNAGVSVIAEIFNSNKKKVDPFDDLFYTHPAILMIEYSLTRTLIENGIYPDYVLGASLGELNSAAVTEVISFEETLICALMQAELIKSNCVNGFMLAIINNPDLFYQLTPIFPHSELAGVNFSSHFVISGSNEELPHIEIYLKNKDILFQKLPLKYGFHSGNIDPSAEEYKKFLQRFTFKKSQMPIISCFLSDYITETPQGFFWDVVRQPIQFQKTICELEKKHQLNYIDVGPSGTLATFVKYNLNKESSSQVYNILTPSGQDLKHFEKIISEFQ